MQQEIARAVAESLQVTLLGTENQSAQSATANVEAHNAYLQGHFLFRRSNIEDFRKAITYFDRAIELDPNYAAVYAERAEVWTLLGDQTGQRTTLFPKARPTRTRRSPSRRGWPKRMRLSGGCNVLRNGTLPKDCLN